ncbi:hypothetical protein [Marinimicrobium sp. ABcell2]|uniref:hypothetical protein n=1 Tax=Marinimicrobium sp. ABcell2 TaxID=3069751 RepID=UPI0027B82EE6|nr:hypothetical protein [Marinimicrobium sp. ABcell2]MDQ2075161.1 hypothetical protein [Marinimicrobium sp. ABcell2]
MCNKVKEREGPLAQRQWLSRGLYGLWKAGEGLRLWCFEHLIRQSLEQVEAVGEQQVGRFGHYGQGIVIEILQAAGGGEVQQLLGGAQPVDGGIHHIELIGGPVKEPGCQRLWAVTVSNKKTASNFYGDLLP